MRARPMCYFCWKYDKISISAKFCLYNRCAHYKIGIQCCEKHKEKAGDLVEDLKNNLG